MNTPVYQSLDEKKEIFDQTIINTKEEFDRFIRNEDEKLDLPKSTPIYKYGCDLWRGCSESKFKLYTSLQRFWLENDLSVTDLDHWEYILKSIEYGKCWSKNLIHRYYQSICNGKSPDNPPALFTLSILRHHNAPSPFLDVTKNILIALYFGCKETHQYKSLTSKYITDDYFSIYCFDQNSIIAKDTMKHELEEQISERESKEKLTEQNKVEISNRVLKNHLKQKNKFCHMISDGILDEHKWHIISNLRILNQDGLFILNTFEDKPLEQVYYESVENDLKEKKSTEPYNARYRKIQKSKLKCFDIHKSLRPFILDFLSSEDVTKDYVYPDFDNLTRDWLNHYFKMR